jgi:hypothetical protein
MGTILSQYVSGAMLNSGQLSSTSTRPRRRFGRNMTSTSARPGRQPKRSPDRERSHRRITLRKYPNQIALPSPFAERHFKSPVKPFFGSRCAARSRLFSKCGRKRRLVLPHRTSADSHHMADPMLLTSLCDDAMVRSQQIPCSDKKHTT